MCFIILKVLLKGEQTRQHLFFFLIRSSRNPERLLKVPDNLIFLRKSTFDTITNRDGEIFFEGASFLVK